MMTGTRILLVSTNLGLGGGAEEQVIQLALSLRGRGWTVHIATMLVTGQLPRELAEAGIPVTWLDMRRGVPDLRAVIRLARLIRAYQPRIVHSHMTHANLLARVTRPFVRVPVWIGTLHGLKMHRVKGGSTRLRELAYRLTDRFADLTTTVCHAAAASYVADGSVPPRKLAVLPNGVDTERFCPDAGVREHSRRQLGWDRSFVWLAVGRFELPKAYHHMIYAFAGLRSGYNSRLIVCGDGSLRRQMERLAETLGIADRVDFLGVRRDVPELMKAADAFVMSSTTEGMPMVLLQASASGLPIVATDVGGNSEVVSDHSGFLVTPGDSAALAAAMQHMESLAPAARARMATAGRAQTVAAYDRGCIASRWERLYRELLSSPGAPRLHEFQTTQGRI